MNNKKYWIVVVDDDAISLKNVKDLLGGQNFRISLVRSGQELITFLKKNRPDLILMDVMMPDMDGFETYKDINDYEKEHNLSHIPVIFLTGENDIASEEKGLMIGASDFIRKPINKDVLFHRIQNILSNIEAIENLTEEAITDRLTGFYNKAYTEEQMPQICKTKQGMLMVLDIDNFKLINDIYGHDVGDNVLRKFSDIARHNCREKDILCRIGGDEFLLFFADTRDENIAYSYTQRINDQLIDVCVSLMGDDFDIPIGISVGCVAVTGKEDYRSLFQYADRALYQVKESGKHACQFYDTRQQIEEGVFEPTKELKRMMTLCTERGKAENAMMVGQDAFISIYRYMERFARRNNEDMAKVIVYLNAEEEIDNEEYMDAMLMFGSILQSSFRKNDVMTKSRSNCYFLLLSEYSSKNEKAIMERVFEKWNDTDFANKFKIGYEVNTYQ